MYLKIVAHGVTGSVQASMATAFVANGSKW